MQKKILLISNDADTIRSMICYNENDYELQNIIHENYQNDTSVNISYKADLVIIDLNDKTLLSGVKIGKQLLHEDTIPFIYISSFTDTVALELIKDSRPYGFLVKPFKKEDLTATNFLVLNNFSHRNIDALRNNQEALCNVSATLRNVITYINENITKKIEIDTLSKITSWKKHHFIRVFTKQLGITPYQYILNKKIELSKSLICQTRLPINEIAYDLGFHNYSNFVCIFKKFCKNTPENYRKAMYEKNKIQNNIN